MDLLGSTTVFSAKQRSAVFVLSVLVVLMATGCSSSAPVAPSTPPPAASSGPAFSALAFDATGLTRHDFRRDEARALIPGGAYLGPAALSPDGNSVAVGYTVGDSAHLAIVGMTDGSVRQLHSARAPITYTATWSPDGQRLAFGFYQPRKSGRVVEMGPGGVGIADASGVRNTGCKASRAVEAWLPDSTLLVRDQRNWQQRVLYVVSAEDCATRAKIDARRMYHISFSPDGRWMAYILRELGDFNRRTRQYAQDSTLYVADTNGKNARKIALAKYHPRHVVWAPDASQIAYDRQAKDHPNVRQIFIYELAGDKHSVLNNNTTTSESHFRWSPTGANFVYDRKLDASTMQKVVRVFGGTQLIAAEAASPGDLPATWGWLDDNLLVLTKADGTSHIFKVNTQKTQTLSTGVPLLDLRRQ